MADFAREAGHYYQRDGSPCYTYTNKKGGTSDVTLREARKMLLVPGFSGIAQLIAKPGLDRWKLQQLLQAALTLPRRDDETEDLFADRVITDSGEQSRKARDKGTWIHGQIERHFLNQPVDPSVFSLVEKVVAALAPYSHDWIAERSFACPLGFGGKIDIHSRTPKVTGDFKVKDVLAPDKKLAYPEHAMQLAAYSHGLDQPDAVCINIFIGWKDEQIHIHEWAPADIERAWEKFLCLLRYWQIDRNYVSAW